jgi:hypothetical protein
MPMHPGPRAVLAGVVAEAQMSWVARFIGVSVERVVDLRCV